MTIKSIYSSLVAFGCFFILSPATAQPPGTTPPTISADITWNYWWTVNSVVQVEAQFNAARRSEESQKGLSNGALGNLDLPDNYLSLPMAEQAWIILKEERECRHGVYYPGIGTVTGYLPEGVESTLSQVAQGHADDMAARDYFSHNTLGGPSWLQRIQNAFPNGCADGKSENIAWNSVAGGHLIGVPLAFYNFIYDDWSCCSGGHRNLCLKQTGNNDYGNPNRLGIVGFGRGTSHHGDYFVMDYIDPSAGCTYDIEPYEECNLPAVVNVNGALYSNTHLAENTVNSDGTVMQGQLVTFKAGNEINLQNNFEVQANTTLLLKLMIARAAEPMFSIMG